jgi:succinyldiaminopimelate transaminase
LKLPDFPWDALAPYGDLARSHPGGAIDLSQGTPVDPTPEFIQSELQNSSNSPSYPVTVGTKELQESIRKYCREILGARGDFEALPSIGSKELVALLPFLLGAQRILIPKIAYPTYRVGGILNRAEVIEVDFDPSNWPTEGVDLVWINSPSNPTGRVHSEDELALIVQWSRKHQISVASDECYLPFPDSERGISILKVADGENTGILALHSLSKRSNLAGYRAAFVAGDPKLISRLLEIRKHIGMMVPLPVQRAMTVALQDEGHVAEQSERYRRRRHLLKPALEAVGFKVEHSVSGLYIWCTRGERDWDCVDWFAKRGILVTPGSFYGDEGGRNVRIALTASDSKILEASQRIVE